MLLSEMMLTRNTDIFNARDIDRNHDWVNESLSRYPEIEEAESFIQQAIGNSETTQVGNNTANIDRRNLTEKQRLILKRVESHCISRINKSIHRTLTNYYHGYCGNGKILYH